MTAPAPPAPPRAPVPRPRHLRAARDDQRATRLPVVLRRPQREPWQAPPFSFSERVAVALVAELAAAGVSLALLAPLGAGVLLVVPVVVAVLVWWVTA